MKTAFSYIRFSSPEQAKGDSFRRQTEKAEAWAAANGYRIEKEWKDLGVSSYRGANATSGNFAEFLQAAKSEELPKGSVLLVENLDRVSRQSPRKALARFLDLIDLGIGVVTLTDNELFTAETLDGDASGMKLFGSLMVMIRANNESRLKGERVAAAWSRKRVAAREKSVPLSDRIPGWLVSKRNAAGQRIFEKDDVRAGIVRRIFTETAQGFGRRTIVKALNREGKVLSFLSNGPWQPSSVIKIIRARTPVGEYQPHKRNEAGRLIPDGEAIKGSYPAVIDEALWVEANDAVNVRRTNSGGRPHAEVANLIRGLAHCVCGERMQFLNKGKPPKGGYYYRCSLAAREGECDNRRLWPAKEVERWLVHHLDPAGIAVTFEPAAKRPGRSVRSFDAEIAEKTAMKDSAIDAALRNAGKALGPDLERRAGSLAEEVEDLRKRRDAAAAERSKPHLPTVRSAIETVAALAAKLGTSSAEEKVAIRTALVQQLRTAFAEILFSRHSIMSLIELPEKPRTVKFGLQRPVTTRKSADGRERYYLRHPIFTDHPEVLADLGRESGYLHSRRSGNP
jgi:DNA invertase Pin-like site-specific DNA recombinase